MKKLNKYKKILKNSSKKDAIKYLLKNGFYKKAGSFNGEVFINKKDRVVAKIGCIICAEKPEEAIPTNQVDSYSEFETWIIQPLAHVDAKSVKRAFEKLAKKYTPRGDGAFYDEVDFHEGNVGIYNNKAVFIDW